LGRTRFAQRIIQEHTPHRSLSPDSFDSASPPDHHIEIICPDPDTFLSQAEQERVYKERIAHLLNQQNNQSGLHTPLPLPVIADKKPNCLIMALKQQNAKMDQMANQNAQILTQNTQSNNKIQLLKTNQGHVPLTNVESLLKYTHNEMKAIQAGTQVCDKTYIDSWENALIWYKATSDVVSIPQQAIK
ncbi:hypothetical protein HK096_000439, partial [Nowakowskiella sp. JEL0078]